MNTEEIERDKFAAMIEGKIKERFKDSKLSEVIEVCLEKTVDDVTNASTDLSSLVKRNARYIAHLLKLLGYKK